MLFHNEIFQHIYHDFSRDTRLVQYKTKKPTLECYVIIIIIMKSS